MTNQLTGLRQQLKAARDKANDAYYSNGRNVSHPEYVAAMEVVRGLTGLIDALKPTELFHSVDSGFHPTRLVSGRTLAAGSAA